MENQRKDMIGLQPTEPDLLYQKPTNHARRTPMEQNLPFITEPLTAQPAAYITKALLPFTMVHSKVKLAVPAILPFGLIPYAIKM